MSPEVDSQSGVDNQSGSRQSVWNRQSVLSRESVCVRELSPVPPACGSLRLVGPTFRSGVCPPREAGRHHKGERATVWKCR